MKEKLIALLNLAPIAPATEVADEQVINAVTELQRIAAAASAAQKSEKEITDLISQSHGALNRDTAKEVLATRVAHTIK
jgi:hypothetical protein